MVTTGTRHALGCQNGCRLTIRKLKNLKLEVEPNIAVICIEHSVTNLTSLARVTVPNGSDMCWSLTVSCAFTSDGPHLGTDQEQFSGDHI